MWKKKWNSIKKILQKHGRFATPPLNHEQIARCQYLADLHQRKIEQIRSVEWQTYFQTFAGYAAIAAAFWTVNQTGVPAAAERVAKWGSIVLTVVVFVAGGLLSAVLQSRMHYEAERLKQRVTQIRECKDPKGGGEIPEESTDGPPLARWYAFGSYIVTSTCSCVGLVWFFCVCR